MHPNGSLADDVTLGYISCDWTYSVFLRQFNYISRSCRCTKNESHVKLTKILHNLVYTASSGWRTQLKKVMFLLLETNTFGIDQIKPNQKWEKCLFSTFHLNQKTFPDANRNLFFVPFVKETMHLAQIRTFLMFFSWYLKRISFIELKAREHHCYFYVKTK